MTDLLIIGAGSVGRRHLRNFSSLGARVWAVDPRPDRGEQARAEAPLEDVYGSTEEAYRASTFSGVVVCSPPKFHREQTVEAVGLGIPVFLEKPAARTVDEVQAMRRAVTDSGVPVLLGYTYRWWEPVRTIRRVLEEGGIGTVRHVRCTLSAHLADWHPWEPYQEFFMASEELGGGALLDESHWLDLIRYLVAAPVWVTGSVGNLSDLEIDSDDNVDAIFGLEGGAQAMLHLDIHGRPHEKSFLVAGSRGTVRWSQASGRVEVGTGPDLWDWHQPVDVDRNDMFLDAAAEFLAVLAGERAPTCTLDDGLAVLEMVEAIRKSSASGRRVDLRGGPDA